MKKIFCSALFCLALFEINAANAASFQFSFDGDIENHNDIVIINFSLINDAYSVKLWTNSYQDKMGLILSNNNIMEPGYK